MCTKSTACSGRARCLSFRYRGSRSKNRPDDTWNGVSFSDEEACAMAERNGFEPRHRHGADTQYFWLWYFKKP